MATAAGARQSAGGGSLQGGGLPQALGGRLVVPAQGGDVAAVSASCRRGGTLTVASGQECAYRLRSGFLARRLRLRLATGATLTAVLAQPKPKVTDTETLDAGHPTAALVYRQDGSKLTLACTAGTGSFCEARID
jgi:hypothetical protein